MYSGFSRKPVEINNITFKLAAKLSDSLSIKSILDEDLALVCAMFRCRFPHGPNPEDSRIPSQFRNWDEEVILDRIEIEIELFLSHLQ